jgi:hypothetical protein
LYLSKNLIGFRHLKNIRGLYSKLTQPKVIFRLKNLGAIFLAGLTIIKKLITIALFDLTKNPKSSNTIISTEEPLHWLVKSKTINNLWAGGGLVLVLLVLSEGLIKSKGYFGIDDTFGFNAWYGFIVCIILVCIAKGLGVFLKRQETYYERD